MGKVVLNPTFSCSKVALVHVCVCVWVWVWVWVGVGVSVSVCALLRQCTRTAILLL